MSDKKSTQAWLVHNVPVKRAVTAVLFQLGSGRWTAPRGGSANHRTTKSSPLRIMFKVIGVLSSFLPFFHSVKIWKEKIRKTIRTQMFPKSKIKTAPALICIFFILCSQSFHEVSDHFFLFIVPLGFKYWNGVTKTYLISICCLRTHIAGDKMVFLERVKGKSSYLSTRLSRRTTFQ